MIKRELHHIRSHASMRLERDYVTTTTPMRKPNLEEIEDKK